MTQRAYHMRMKLIHGKIVSRLDFPASSGDAAARSVVTDGTHLVMYETNSQKILKRSTMPDGATVPGSASRLIGRIDVESTKKTLQKKFFASAMDSSGRYLTCTAPSSFIAQMPASVNGTTKTMKIMFDQVDGTLVGCFQEQVLNTGEIVDTTTNNTYQMIDGQPMLTGTVTQEVHRVPGSLPVGNDLLPQVFDPGNVPVIARADLENMRKNSLVVAVDPIMGDRTNPCYMNTTVTKYDNISINSVGDADFAMLNEREN
jgi:hypothetical protein